MKKVFEEPSIEILELSIIDIITDSIDPDAGEEDEF